VARAAGLGRSSTCSCWHVGGFPKAVEATIRTVATGLELKHPDMELIDRLEIHGYVRGDAAGTTAGAYWWSSPRGENCSNK